MESNANWDHCLEYAAVSDLGLRRANNQDSKAVVIASSQEKWLQRGHLFMVADGMGAHAAGELASKLATDFVPLAYHKITDQSPPEALLAAVQEANTQIHTRGQANEDFRGMGTTLSALVLLPQGALVAQVGDSRVYRLRNQKFEQLTFDHSLVWELRAAGQIPMDSIPSFVPKNVITRSLGPNPQVQVDLEGLHPVEVGDVYLLCSDGLSGQVKDDEMGKMLGCLPLAEAVRALVDLANLRGGPDNITVVAVRITAPLTLSAPEGAGSASAPRPTRPVSPVLWSLLGIATLVALALAAVDLFLPAAVAAAVAVVSAIAALVQRYGGAGGGYQFDGRLLGKGPYTSTDCVPDADFLGRLTEIIRQLQEAASQDGWTVDWNRFHGHRQTAEAAARERRHEEAVREYCRAVSFMMDELKKQRGRKRPNGASAIDFL
jgi:protein phosphatase